MSDKNYIEELNEEAYGVKTHRCSICNCVNREDIETNLGDYKQTSFVKDPSNSLFYVCIECNESIDEVNREYEFMEDEWEIG